MRECVEIFIPKVGSRFSCDGEKGTVRWIGNVSGTNGNWLGVEWDDSSRGKHDGTHDGVKYFTTRSPKGGSFLRPERAFFGVNCSHAIRERYGRLEGKLAGVEKGLLEDAKKDWRAPFVEVVGFNKVNLKQSRFNKLKDVAVRDEDVSGESNPEEIGNLVPNVRDLDLSRNLLSSWKDVANITKYLRNLRALRLSGNLLMLPDGSDELKENFRSVDALSMNRCLYTWDDIMECMPMFPNLTYLSVAYNRIESLSSPGKLLSNITELDMMGNKLWSWKEVNKLGNLPNLAMLNLNECQLGEVEFPGAAGEVMDIFPSLTTLMLLQNKIHSWSSIDELNKLGKLTDLLISKNPVMELESPQTTEQYIVAKLSRLQRLNRTIITKEDRKGSELYYMKKFGSEWFTSKDDKLKAKIFHAQHPRYQQFIQMYGALEEGEFRQKSNTMKSSLVPLNLRAAQDDNFVKTKKFPPSMTVHKAKFLISKMFSIPADDLQLGVLSFKHPEHEVPMDNDLKELSFYDIEAGDTLIVRTLA